LATSSASATCSSAQRALDTILEQGEGARGHWETAHFGQFVQILDEYLLPHRGCAWALLEERVRDASSFSKLRDGELIRVERARTG
jgi:hypothetical protein